MHTPVRVLFLSELSLCFGRGVWKYLVGAAFCKGLAERNTSAVGLDRKPPFFSMQWSLHRSGTPRAMGLVGFDDRTIQRRLQ